jgi:uncharacterized protein with FMN-binding domain
MRRAVLALGGTVAGLAALFSYKTHVPTFTALTTPITPTESATSPSATPTMMPPTTKPSATKSASAKPTAKKTTAPASTPPPTTQAPASTPPPTTQAPAPPPKPSGTFTGQAVDTNYGPVQVQITVSDGKITQADGQDEGGSSIGQNAIPQLNQEAVQAQSASIQAVSGATYTSEGYIQSLQQAIDSAHI